MLANPGGVVDTQHLLLPQEIGSSIGARSGAPAQETPEASPDTLVDALLSSTPRFEDIEHLVLCRTLALCKGNISATARALQMHRRTLQRKLLKHPVREAPTDSAKS